MNDPVDLGTSVRCSTGGSSSAAGGLGELGAAFESMAAELAERLELPSEILDGSDRRRCPAAPLSEADPPLRRRPALRPACRTGPDGMGRPIPDVRRRSRSPTTTSTSAARSPISKLLLNVFGPNTRSPSCTRGPVQPVVPGRRRLRAVHGLRPGHPAPGGRGPPAVGHERAAGSGSAATPRAIDDRQLREELVAMESDLIKRMDLREVLKDDRLAAQLTPSMPLVEQLLHDKSNLSGPALANARRLIKKYVDELAAVLKKQVFSTKSGEIDRSVPPKRVYPQPRPQAHGLEEPAPLQPRRRPALRQPALLSPHGAEVVEQVPDRRGRPVGLDGQRDGPVRDPGVDLRDACRGSSSRWSRSTPT